MWVALGVGGLVVLCLCLVIGIGGGVALYLTRNQSVTAAVAAVEYVLDASPRMALPGESGAPRLAVARGVLAEIVRPADPSELAGLRVFGTGASTATCQDTSLLVPLALRSQQLISDKASAVDAGKSTDSALAQAIVAAIRDLAAKNGSHSLVVVTGGADSCNPEASQVVAQEAKRSGIDLETYVVGFGVSDSDAQAIKVIVDQTPKARYLGAKNEAELRTTLRGVQDRIDHPASKYTGQTACDYPYYPLRKGATWEYTMGTQTINEEITAVTGDATNAVATESYTSGGVSGTFDLTCGPEGIVSFELSNLQSSSSLGSGQIKVTSHSGSMILPPAQLAPGSTWDENYTMAFAFSQGGQSLNMTDDVAEKFTAVGVETITTAAGKFDALRVESTGTVTVSGMPAIGGSNGTMTLQTSMTQWYARGVGMVRMITGGTSSITQELTKYNVP
jgi:hypothetical protein